MTARLQDTGILTDDFLGRVAGDFGKCVIHTHNDRIGIGNHHGLARFERGRRDPSYLFTLLQKRDVRDDGKKTCNTTIGVDIRDIVGQHVGNLAVDLGKRPFKILWLAKQGLAKARFV